MPPKENPNYHPGDTTRQANPVMPEVDINAMSEVKAKGQELIDLIQSHNDRIGGSRDLLLAIDKAEESVMRAVKGITA